MSAVTMFREPAPDECDRNATILARDGTTKGIAFYYPQMGGYHGRAVMWASDCVEVLVWHDGSFPFGEGDRSPVHLHHCDGDQFIEVGELMKRLPDLS